MAKLAVKPLKIFGSALSPSGNVAQHGSTAAGAAVYSDDPTVLQALAAWLNGYAAAVVGRVHALKVADETAGRTSDIPPAHQSAPPEEVVLDDRPAWNDDEPQTEGK